MHWVPAAGLGVFRSSDGGATWESIAHEMGALPSAAIAIRPDRPQVLLAGGLNADQHGTVFYSDDHGESWQSTDLLLDWAWVTDLVIDPLNPDRVYAGSEEGLYYSVDGGQHWEPWAAGLGRSRCGRSPSPRTACARFYTPARRAAW
jgi:photosystem II stability/assembly factor-like uncharacterized protein